MSLCAEGSLTGCLITVDTSYLADEYYTKSTLLLGPPSLSITALIWVEHSASFFFVSLWIHGIIMYIKSQGSLSTVDIWMIMPQVAQALNGFFPAQTSFQKFSDAGFVVLSHHCYTVECNS